MKLKNKVALVTGASRGIGYAVAKCLAKNGAHIIATARTEGGLVELDDAISDAGGSASLVVMDLLDRPALPRLAGAIQERWGRLDIMILNAGMLGTLAPIAHLDEAVWDDVLATNLTACFRIIHHLDPLFRQSEAGRAVLVSSGAADANRPYWGRMLQVRRGLKLWGKGGRKNWCRPRIKSICSVPDASLPI